MKLEFRRRTFENPQVSNIMKIWPFGDELDETDRQTYMTMLLAPYSKSQTRLKCKSYEALYHAAVSKPLAHVTRYFQKYSRQHSIKYLKKGYIRFDVILTVHRR